MALEVYDYRKHTHNVISTPQVRSRFETLPPGRTGMLHNHTTAIECWYVIQGKIEFEINGETAILEPGMLICAMPGEKHRVRVLSEEPVIQLLFVAPHILPIANMFKDGKETHQYRRHPADNDRNVAVNDPAKTEKHFDEMSALAMKIAESSRQHEELKDAILTAQTSHDYDKAVELFDTLLPGIMEVSSQYYEMVEAWSDMTGNIGELRGANK